MKNDQMTELFGKKGAALCRRFFGFEQRFPKLFPKKLIRNLACFLSNCSESFLEERSFLHLSKIVFAHTQLIQKSRDSPSCLVKIYEITPALYGLALVWFTEHREASLFVENHLINEAQNIVLGIKSIANSFVFFRNETVFFGYLEIKKIRGGRLSHEEKKRLRTELPAALERGMRKSLSPSLFFPENQEALFKNIRILGKELRYVNDLPQVMLTIVECFNNTFKFLVIALRVLKPNTRPIKELATKLSPWIDFSLENIVILEKVRGKYLKEATIFTMQISSPLDSDQPGGELRIARKYITKALESMMGPFRDYNGGFTS